MKRRFAVVLSWIVLLSAPALAIEPSAPPRSIKVLRVMIVAPREWQTQALVWVDFLETKGVESVVLNWEETRTKKTGAFDLVVIAGPGRRASLEKAHLDFDKPVLGMGPYGCRVFGKFKLKHGHPYT